MGKRSGQHCLFNNTVHLFLVVLLLVAVSHPLPLVGHRITFIMRRLRGGSSRLSDIRVAIYGPAALTALARRTGELQNALPKHSFYAVHAEPKLFFDPSSYLGLVTSPEIIGLHISPKGRGGEKPIPGSLYAWAAERFA
jgi:hypothetical protein